jgi:hypothetical protein
MLIVGAIPEQQSKFVIPPNYMPVYIENDPQIKTYGRDANKGISANTGVSVDKDFDSYPLVIGHAPDDLPKHSFDLVIFDNSVIKFNPLNKILVDEYRSLLRNKDSLLVLDNIMGSYTQPLFIYLRTPDLSIDVITMDAGVPVATTTNKVVYYPSNKHIARIDTKTNLLAYSTQMYLNGTQKLDGRGLMHILAINLWEMYGNPVADVLSEAPNIDVLLDTPPHMAICLENVFHRNKAVNLPYIYVGGKD